jgi:hypothetical protein
MLGTYAMKLQGFAGTKYYEFEATCLGNDSDKKRGIKNGKRVAELWT